MAESCEFDNKDNEIQTCKTDRLRKKSLQQSMAPGRNVIAWEINGNSVVPCSRDPKIPLFPKSTRKVSWISLPMQRNPMGKSHASDVAKPGLRWPAINPLDMQFDVHLFLATKTAIAWNKSRDLFQPITVAITKKKYGLWTRK